MRASELVKEAFHRLAKRGSYSERPAQVQLALLLSDLIEERSTGMFEAPTGLGKSLAALVPAVANAIANGRRTVIATYTNVLAEQYWRKDLPLALSLFDEESGIPQCALLMGRQRYACQSAIREHTPANRALAGLKAENGIETEVKRLLALPQAKANQLWQQISVPPVCPGRLCPDYGECYYYNARKRADSAGVVITNHSVVIQHALMRNKETGEGLLGDIDFLIVDEAHDFPPAAQNGLEFELSTARLSALSALSSRLESTLEPIAQRCGDLMEWAQACIAFRQEIGACQEALASMGYGLNRSGILITAPPELGDHPQVAAHAITSSLNDARSVARMAEIACSLFEKTVEKSLERWRLEQPERVDRATEAVRNYRAFVREFGMSTSALFEPKGVAVTYVGWDTQNPKFRQDVIDLATPLREILWSVTPHALISATAALDSSFEFLERLTGVKAEFQEILPSPFDHATNAAIYLPKEGAVPDPSRARSEGREPEYYYSIANELSRIIKACEGRTLALFHSRKEMEAVAQLVSLPPDLPLMVQARQNVAEIGQKFVANPRATLFGLRSYWTGFDAPGETLSCVVLVRVPFEVPIEPPQIARLAHLQGQGLDAFASHTLPVAKMMMRQGVGRLLRRSDDKGIIALLDPRLRSKRYGQEILDNLPPGMRVFDDIEDAVGFVGLDVGAVSL